MSFRVPDSSGREILTLGKFKIPPVLRPFGMTIFGFDFIL